MEMTSAPMELCTWIPIIPVVLIWTLPLVGFGYKNSIVSLSAWRYSGNNRVELRDHRKMIGGCRAIPLDHGKGIDQRCPVWSAQDRAARQLMIDHVGITERGLPR